MMLISQMSKRRLRAGELTSPKANIRKPRSLTYGNMTHPLPAMLKGVRPGGRLHIPKGEAGTYWHQRSPPRSCQS